MNTSAEKVIGGYRVEPVLVTTQAEAIIQTWVDCHPDDPGARPVFTRRYEWLYLRNPAGASTCWFLWHTGTHARVGMTSVGPRQFHSPYGALQAGLLFDFVVHPAHRSLFPALHLQREVQGAALAMMQATYGLPDKSAEPVLRRLHGPSPISVPRYARVLRYSSYCRRFLPAPWAALAGALLDLFDVCRTTVHGWRGKCILHQVPGFDERFDALWARADLSRGITARRDREFLQWRFGDEPGIDHVIYLACDKQTELPHTYFVGVLTAGAFTIRDLLTVGTSAEFADALRGLSLELRRRGAATLSLSLLAGEDTVNALHRTGFVVRDRRLCFVNWSKDCGVPSDAAWYLTQADEDI